MADDDLTPDALRILSTLVGFDTTSRLSNLALIEWVEAYLAGHGIASRRVPNADGSKTNLMATVGPMIAGGVVLSGHTDVVPVDGQPWTTDPFTVVERDGRLYGRGTCDMKGFLALALAAVPGLVAADPKRPVHLAFSYDEEVGCLGAPAMIARIVEDLPAPALVVVGEPTDMVAVNGHKGISTFTVTVSGREAHSSQTQQGVSAIMEAVPLMAALTDLGRKLERDADPASPFTPKGATLTIGVIHGGTAGNILARECVFLFDLRCPPGLDPDAVLAPFLAQCAALDLALKDRAPETGVNVVRRSSTPPLAPEPNGAAEVFARRLAGDNG
ncbi:MAG: acetylornithine deacetylase, partial [Caulobacteraceae bacterium]|nr:acetylornithine deacetylase [Caulobacteraceae bacterium]